MPAVSSFIAAAAVIAAGVGTKVQSNQAKKQAKVEARANKKAEDTAEVQSKNTQAVNEQEEADITLESTQAATDKKKQKGSRLLVGKGAAKPKPVSGVTV